VETKKPKERDTLGGKVSINSKTGNFTQKKAQAKASEFGADPNEIEL